jgi:hypothetical protein
MHGAIAVAGRRFVLGFRGGRRQAPRLPLCRPIRCRRGTTFKEFSPSQRMASFSVDQIVEQMQKTLSSMSK